MIYMYKEDLELNSLQLLICQKTETTQTKSNKKVSINGSKKKSARRHIFLQ